eukprot:COSAG02_NODE_425_length_22574_cov_29.550300_7_plen_699_part_00
MPKKKKAFIDKDAASTFQVVNRARRDPLSQQEGATPNVLAPSFTGNQRKKADRERLSAATAPADLGDFAPRFNQKRFGGSELDATEAANWQYDRREWEKSSYQLPQDGYDYMKHMTEMGGGHYQGITSDQIAAREAELKEAARRKAQGTVELREAVLPEEVLPNVENYHSSGYEELEYELDPEVLAAMEDAENDAHDDVGWEMLEDDFVAQVSDPNFGMHLDHAMQQYEERKAAEAARGEREPEPAGDGSSDDWPSDDDDRLGQEQYSEEEEEPPTEEEMIDQIFTYADEDGNGLINMQEFIELQEACGNETPNEEQWRMMLGALKCDPDPQTGGLTQASLTLLYGAEGPWDDFAALGFGPGDDDGPMPEALAQLIAEKEGKNDGAGATQDRGDSRVLDEQFAAMANEWDDDDDIGNLDGDEDRTRLENGGMDVSAYEGLLDEFISEQERAAGEGAMILDNKAQSSALKEHVLARAEAQAEREEERKAAGKTDDKRLADVAEYRNSARAQELADDFDAETIVSTYSNTENHPGFIQTGRRMGSKERKRREAAKARQKERGVVFGSALDPLKPRTGDIILGRKGLPMLPEQNEAAIIAAEEEEEEEEEECEGEEGEEEEQQEEEEWFDTAIGRNGKKGKGPKETPEEKRARKAAVKAERAAARARKKSLKSAYKKEEAVQGKRQTSAAGAMRGRVVIGL